jgi:hypothetical protein
VSLIHRGEEHKVGRFKREERLVIERHSTFLSREKHRVATDVLFYQAERQKHCVIRKAILGIQKSIPQFL